MMAPLIASSTTTYLLGCTLCHFTFHSCVMIITSFFCFTFQFLLPVELDVVHSTYCWCVSYKCQYKKLALSFVQYTCKISLQSRYLHNLQTTCFGLVYCYLPGYFLKLFYWPILCICLLSKRCVKS